MRTLLLAVLACLAVAPCRAELPLAAAIEGLRTQARAQVAAGRLDELLADLDQSLRTQARLADGRWKLALQLGSARRAFEAVAQGPADWDRNEAALKALAARHPESPNAWILQAQFEEAHAWAERGRGLRGQRVAGRLRRVPASPARRPRRAASAPDPRQPGVVRVGGSRSAARSATRPRNSTRSAGPPSSASPTTSRPGSRGWPGWTPQWGGSLRRHGPADQPGRRARPSGTERSGMMARLLWIASGAGPPRG